MTGFAAPANPELTRRSSVRLTVVVPTATCLLTVAAVLTVLIAEPRRVGDIAVPVFLIGASAIFGLGLSDLARGRDVRFARALIIAGLLWSLSALSASGHSTPYSIGRIGYWLVELAIAYVLLAFPSGRLVTRADRAVFAGAVLLVGLLYLPTALVVHQFPHPSVWSMCRSACPGNAFAVNDSTPWAVAHLLIPTREVLTVILFAALARAVWRRGRSAGPLLGQLYVPIVWIAIAQVVVFVVYFALRRAVPGSDALPVVTWASVLAVPAIALACALGRLYRRLFATSALARIARGVRTSATPANVHSVMASALEDPSLRILHSFPGDVGGWVDETGAPVPRPRDSPGEDVTEVANGSWRIAIVHDPALAEDPALMQTAASYALSALENDRLSGELRSSLQRLAESQARGIAAEDRERQKIERDIHDGAQQRLVAMRMKLGLAAEQFEGLAPAGAEVIRALAADIDATIDEVRGLARGVYPPLLVQTGLREALRAIGRLSPLPTTVQAEQLHRYPTGIETTVYFCCSEALQNAVKHASGASGVSIRVWEEQQLHFEVSDDGVGFDPESTSFGIGLGSLHERVAAVDGTIAIRSGPDQGTRVTGVIPI